MRLSKGMGGHGQGEEEVPKPTKEVCDKAGIPRSLRDPCAGYLIKLKECRDQNYFLPWRFAPFFSLTFTSTLFLSIFSSPPFSSLWNSCGHERHEYEKCEYKEFRERVRIQNQRLQQN